MTLEDLSKPIETPLIPYDLQKENFKSVYHSKEIVFLSFIFA
jgi:hypothetical protein